MQGNNTVNTLLSAKIAAIVGLTSILTAVITVIALYFLLGGSRSSQVPMVEDNVKSAIIELNARVSDMAKQLHMLEKEFGALSKDMQRMDIQDNAKSSVQPGADAAKPAAVDTISETPAREGGQLTRHQYLIRQWSQEQSDAQWSNVAEQQIHIAAPKAAGKARLVSAQCRQSLCKIEISHSSLDDAGTFIENFSEKLNWTNSMMEIFYKNSKSTDIFITRGDE